VRRGNREHFDKLSASQGTVSRFGWELFFLGIKLKCKVFEFPPRKYLSKINLTFLEKRKISVFLICSLFPVPCSLSKI
jgi:hypothetical protein